MTPRLTPGDLAARLAAVEQRLTALEMRIEVDREIEAAFTRLAGDKED